MKRLTEKDIEEINKKGDPWYTGIFIESSYVPTDIKGPCCVLRWNSEGRGGSCWDDENTVNEIYYYERPEFTIFNLTLDKIGVSDFAQRKDIESMLMREVDDAGRDRGYYGDYDDYRAEWIELEAIYKYLEI